MGGHPGISATQFPRQSEYVNTGALVVFHYEIEHQHTCVIVRDDIDDPWETIIRLSDGRHVLGTECQWRPS